MIIYRQFHGNMILSLIDKELRHIVKRDKKSFKILTGYGSKTGQSSSKVEAIKSLTKMQRQGLIKGFIPGEVKKSLLYTDSPYYENKLKFDKLISKDPDYGNEGIIFVFV